MPMHFAGYYSAAFNHAVLSDLQALKEKTLTRNDGVNYIVPALNNIIGGHIAGSGLVQAQVQAPSLRASWEEDVTPIYDGGVLPQSDQAVNEGGAATYTIRQGEFFFDKVYSPLVLAVSEVLELLAKNGGAQDTVGSLIFADKVPSPITTPYRSIRCTTTAHTTGTKGWEELELTFPQSLPVGKYSLVGCEGIITNGVLARFSCPQNPYEMGFYPKQHLSDRRPYYFRSGWLGEWGQFDNINLPTLEVVDNGNASSAEELFLDIVKIG